MTGFRIAETALQPRDIKYVLCVGDFGRAI
jgi:hypothetical protein